MDMREGTYLGIMDVLDEFPRHQLVRQFETTEATNLYCIAFGVRLFQGFFSLCVALRAACSRLPTR